MKKLIVVGIIIACVWLMYAFPYVMLNPGKLIEGHQKLDDKCQSCHSPFWGAANSKCISCHKLSEIGKDSLPLGDTNAGKIKILFHQGLTSQKCTSCHSDHQGRNPMNYIGSFKHDLLAENDRNNCSSCHGKPMDKLHAQISTSCNRCHTTKGWKVSVVFNHDMIENADKNNCTACHQKPNDTYHQLINDNCSKCHTANQWKPSTFDHSNYFQLDRNHNASCATCHSNNNYSTYTCYGCHEHSESKILEEHREVSISNLNNCAACHKSGNEHDIRMNKNSNIESKQDGKNTPNSNPKQKQGEDEDSD